MCRVVRVQLIRPVVDRYLVLATGRVQGVRSLIVCRPLLFRSGHLLITKKARNSIPRYRKGSTRKADLDALPTHRFLNNTMALYGRFSPMPRPILVSSGRIVSTAIGSDRAISSVTEGVRHVDARHAVGPRTETEIQSWREGHEKNKTIWAPPSREPKGLSSLPKIPLLCQ